MSTYPEGTLVYTLTVFPLLPVFCTVTMKYGHSVVTLQTILGNPVH